MWGYYERTDKPELHKVYKLRTVGNSVEEVKIIKVSDTHVTYQGVKDKRLGSTSIKLFWLQHVEDKN